MRGTVAKRIRREVYDDQSPRARSYSYRRIIRRWHHVLRGKKLTDTERDIVSADALRQRYQRAKRAHRRNT